MEKRCCPTKFRVEMELQNAIVDSFEFESEIELLQFMRKEFDVTCASANELQRYLSTEEFTVEHGMHVGDHINIYQLETA